VLDRVITELGQGPTAVGKADRRWCLVGKAAQGGLLLGSDPRRCPTPVVLTHPVQSPAVEGMQVGLNRVGVQGKEARDRRRIPTLGMQDEGFGTAQLLAVGGGVEQLTKLTKFSGGGPTGGHGAGHSCPLRGRKPPAIVPRAS